jgi:hypothetical protein
MVGEEELIKNIKRVNSAYVLETATLYYINKKELMSAMSESKGCKEVLIEKARIKG